jgi:AAA-like domain/TIR domain
MRWESTKDSAAPVPSPGGVAPFVFISYRSQEPDIKLAHDFSEALRSAGCDTFMAAESLRVGDEWPAHIEAALRRCDYFLLLLSAKSAASDMVTEEVRRARHLRETRPDRRPRILPVRVNLPFGELLNYELDGFLGGIQQLLWKSPGDTPPVVTKVIEVIGTGCLKGQDGEGAEADEEARLPAARRQEGPLPVAEPEWPEGRVPQDSKFYIVRPFVEKDCFDYVMKTGALIRLRAPRQMGKTSLLARILYHAQKRGCATGQISFQLVSAGTLSDLGSFLRHFCRSVGKIMDVPNRLDELWDKENDVVDSCTTYFTDYLLPELERPFVLGLDETDKLFQYPEVAAEFFVMLRAWKDGAANDELWGKFRVVLVHSTECYLTLPVYGSPFNVGRGFRLSPFDERQTRRLANKHGLEFDDDVRALFELVGGHPYLSRLALYYVARKEKTFADIMRDAHTEAGAFSDHLRRQHWSLSQQPELIEAVRSLARTQGPVGLDPTPAFKLEGAGLVRRVGNEVNFSCELYRKYFHDRFAKRR